MSCCSLLGRGTKNHDRGSQTAPVRVPSAMDERREMKEVESGLGRSVAKGQQPQRQYTTPRKNGSPVQRSTLWVSDQSIPSAQQAEAGPDLNAVKQERGSSCGGAASAAAPTRYSRNMVFNADEGRGGCIPSLSRFIVKHHCLAFWTFLTASFGLGACGYMLATARAKANGESSLLAANLDEHWLVVGATTVVQGDPHHTSCASLLHGLAPDYCPAIADHRLPLCPTSSTSSLLL